MVRAIKIEISLAHILPGFILQLEPRWLAVWREGLQIWQHPALLQECDKHEIDAEGVEPAHLVGEAGLVPRLQVERQLDESRIVGPVSANEVRV